MSCQACRVFLGGDYQFLLAAQTKECVGYPAHIGCGKVVMVGKSKRCNIRGLLLQSLNERLRRCYACYQHYMLVCPYIAKFSFGSFGE